MLFRYTAVPCLKLGVFEQFLRLLRAFRLTAARSGIDIPLAAQEAGG